jgi:hypothetical protein
MPQKESVLTNIHTVYIPKVYLISELINKSKLKMKKELQDMDIVAEGVPQFYNVQSGYYKHKSKTIPPIPKFVDDIKLKDDWTLCEDGNRRFLVKRDEQEKCESIIFCSDIGLTILS